jgi:hypothetical protein
MASISKVTRNSNEAPSHLTIHEWFNYANSTISAVGRLSIKPDFLRLNQMLFLGLRDFPSLDDSETPVVKSKTRSKQFEQNAESIFILPAFELRFQTRQLEGKTFPSNQFDRNLLLSRTSTL